ncbi:CRTAC1 family protein [Candidatus Poribacteria bacterium]|nr:CRTAC1 family protein [Candidatus Poribacteria bacterium]
MRSYKEYYIHFYLLVICFLISSAAFGGSEKSNVTFIDVAESSGINFVHTDGNSGKRFVLEILGGGAAFFDYDNDGWLDIYLVNGAHLIEPKPKVKPTNVLYHNNGDGTFADVTELAGVGDTGYGVGCSAGDYDNDGDLDLYVTNFGPNVLYRNNGDGTFTDVTAFANVGSPLLSTGCAWTDYDNDGDIDLYVANYVDWTVETDRACYAKELRVYCNPKIYPGTRDVLYRNNGDGTFTDVSEKAGIWTAPPNRGLGVVAGDYDNDGDQDLYIANDMDANYLFQNNGDGTFEEIGLLAGVGYGENGEAEAGMGADAGDYDNDGLLDFIVGNFQNEPCRLYHNDGYGLYTDVSYTSGIGEVTYRYLTWGIVFFDYDNDGYKDIFVANGHIQDNIAQFDNTTTYEQPNLLLRNRGDGTFEDVTSSAFKGLENNKVSRAVALGDYDNDGDIDILVTNWNGKVELLRNEGGNRKNWIKIKTVGVKSNRPGIGAKIKVVAAEITKEAKLRGLSQFEDVQTSGGYASTHDFSIHFGIGGAEKVDLIEIQWPSGLVQRKENIEANQIVLATEGE